MIFYILLGMILIVTITSILSSEKPAATVCMGIPGIIYCIIAIRLPPSLIGAMLLGLIVILQLYLYLPIPNNEKHKNATQ